MEEVEMTPNEVHLTLDNPIRCIYCTLHFRCTQNLRKHLLRKHAVPFLSDDGRFPPHLSQQHLDAALESILQPFRTHQFQCPFCGKCGFRFKSNAKLHFLRHHLNNIIKATEKITDGKILLPHINPELISRKNKLWVCVPCRKSFVLKESLKQHRLSKHITTFLKGHISADVSERDAKFALRRIISLRTTIVSRDGKGQPLYGCLWCNDKVKVKIRRHLFNCHLAEVVEEICKTDKSLSARDASSREEIMSCLRCVKCERNFSCRVSFRNHLVRAHPLEAFSGRIPHGVKEEDLVNAISAIVAKCKVKNDDDNGENWLFKCPHCERKMKREFQLRLHIMRAHLEKVIAAMGIIIIEF